MAKESVKQGKESVKKWLQSMLKKEQLLKAAGDYAALDLTSKECITCSFKKPLPAYWPSKRLYASFWCFKRICSGIWRLQVKFRV